MSRFTPTSMYWKLTTGVPVAPTKAGWKLPDAIGTCWPIRIEASLPSVARTLGFCTSFVFELLARNWAVVGGIVIEKLPLLMFCKPRSVVNNDGVHGRALREIAHVQQCPQSSYGFRDLRRCDAVRQVDRFQHKFV